MILITLTGESPEALTDAFILWAAGKDATKVVAMSTQVYGNPFVMFIIYNP